MGALIAAVHDGLVGPFEIERIDESFPQPLVLEDVPPSIEEPALRSRRRIVRNHVTFDATVANRRKIVARRPDARGELLLEQVALGGETLERHVAIAVVFVADDVEIVLPARYRQVAAPPILDPLVFDIAPGLEAPDLVGAAAQRHVQRRLVEGTAAVVGARKNRQRGHEQRDITRALRGKAHDHRSVIGRLRADEIPQQLVGDRVTLLLEDVERESDVMRGERTAVVKPGAGSHQKAAAEPILGYLHGARGQPVHGVRLVLGAYHQAREGQLHSLRAVAFEDEAVERIEGEKILVVGAGRPDVGEHAALARIGIDIVEMLEVGVILQVAEGRHAVARGIRLRTRGANRDRRQGAGAEHQRLPTADLAGGFAHYRDPTLAALSGSHHHIVGNADEPYFGNGSGRPKRSQRAVRVVSEVNWGTT